MAGSPNSGEQFTHATQGDQFAQQAQEGTLNNHKQLLQASGAYEPQITRAGNKTSGGGSDSNGQSNSGGDGQQQFGHDLGGGWFNRTMTFIDGKPFTGNRSIQQLQNERMNDQQIQTDLQNALTDFLQGDSNSGMDAMRAAHKLMKEDPNLAQISAGMDLHLMKLDAEGLIPIWGPELQQKKGIKDAKAEMHNMQTIDNDISRAIGSRSSGGGGGGSDGAQTP